MDFRLPQPLKYSLIKKKSRRKVPRKETGKLSLKNHNKNASCQTDSSESSEISSASSAKKNYSSVNSSDKTDQKKEELPHFVDLESIPKTAERFIYHYCTPVRRKVNSRVNYLEASDMACNVPDVSTASGDWRQGSLEVGNMLKKRKPSLHKFPQDIEKPTEPSYSIRVLDSDSTSDGDDVLDQSFDRERRKLSDSQSGSSDTSKGLLESSLYEDTRSSRVISTEADQDKIDKNNSEKTNDAKPQFRSSVLYRKFNRAVENDLSRACNGSDFYLRVKKRVLGMHQSTSENVIPEEICNPEEKINNTDAQQCFKHQEFLEDNKENIDGSTPQSSNFLSFYERVRRRVMIVPESEESSVGDPCSPKPFATSTHSLKINDSCASVGASLNGSNKSGPVFESSNLTSKSIESKNSCQSSHESDKVHQTLKKNSPKQESEMKNKCVIPDSDDSSSGEFQGRRRTIVVGSSDSSIVEIKSDTGEEIYVIGDDEGTRDVSNTEGNISSEKTTGILEDGRCKSGSSGIFRKVTRRALILDSSDSVSTHAKDLEASYTNMPHATEEKDMTNLQFKPGFSTLSQSKHEDIKKWLNTVQCQPETNQWTFNVEGTKDNLDPVSVGCADDNITLTDMEKVLDELYGKNWGGKKKCTPKQVPRKKESVIIYERVTDSDDSSTPPLPASTHSRRKLYHQSHNLFTPQGSNIVTPNERPKLFTPLTSIGKKGGNVIHKTPKTVGSKSKNRNECLNSGAFSSPVLTFLSSLSVGHQSARCHPEVKYFLKNFKSKKEELALKLFHIFNEEVFQSKLPHDMPILWNNRLRKTAGYCYNRRVKNSEGGFTRTSRVELSSKIVDNGARLRDTLIHELCHAATWIISEVTGGHGPCWKKWTIKAMKAFPELPPISRCHNYDIVTKYKYKCSSCNYSIGRHSKSLDIQRKCCGICGGTFELFLNGKDEKGKSMPQTPRTPNAFALFVKDNYKAVKNAQDNLKHKDVMKVLSEKFAATKISSNPCEK